MLSFSIYGREKSRWVAVGSIFTLCQRTSLFRLSRSNRRSMLLFDKYPPWISSEDNTRFCVRMDRRRHVVMSVASVKSRLMSSLSRKPMRLVTCATSAGEEILINESISIVCEEGSFIWMRMVVSHTNHRNRSGIHQRCCS